ncbi:papain-like cysteine protease family protein [Xanthomonas arboricola]|uniref:papain-like cysteine protease family protein n=1 Tax=Xanthomonas arboricola TaxID=56448 RepID=UPI000E1ECFCD|nr:papain-like cysteine protease family protein [Xanthomonas arboricola]
MARIRATRDSVNDRFNVLSFSVRSDPPLFEIGLATDPELLKPENRARRTSRTFFSSLVQPGTKGRDAMYLVPPSVVARFVGQPRLYFGLATYSERDRARPIEVQMPDRGNMYVSLSGLTERSLRRTARSDGNNGYGGDSASLAWGADAVVGAAPAAAVAPATDPGRGGYSDGYSDELWQTPASATPPAQTTPAATVSPEASTPAASSSPDAAAATAAAQSWRPASQAVPTLRSAPVVRAPSSTQTPRHGSAPVNALRVIDQYDSPTTLGEALLAQLAFFASSARWVFGVVNTTVAPYSAICQVRRLNDSDEGEPAGTAFFIAPRLLLTAAHVVDGKRALIIVPGKHDAGTTSESEPFGRFQVTSDAWVIHPAYNASQRDFDMALIRVPEANAVAYPQYFDILEQLTQSREEQIVVSGYAARSLDSSTAGTVVNAVIDPDRQHMHGGRIRQLPTDDTFAYDVQSLGGTSGSPVYYIDTTEAPRAHVVGVHVAQHDATTNLGCRMTDAKLAWIRQQALDWSQAVSFSLGVQDSQNGATPRRSASAMQTGQAMSPPHARPAPPRSTTNARALIIGPDDVERAQRYAPQWADLFNWRAPAAVEQAVSARGMSVQRIADAQGELSLDRYEVRCERLPDGWTGPEVLEHLRLHLNDFVDTAYSEFIPYDSGVDDIQWESSTPVGTVFKVNIGGPDNASVVVSLVEPTRWRFTTVHTEWSGDHPVSGHREFGIRDDNGTTVFYTRGADRWTGGPGAFIGFFAADRLWKSFQDKLVSWLMAGDGGGSASAPAPFSERFHPEVVRILYPTTAQSLSTRSLSDAPVHEYDVPLIAQPDKRTCWAAAMAMLLSYRRHASIDPETLANEVGTTLSTSYSFELLDAVRQRYGFNAIEQPSNTSLYHTPQQWADWLNRHGPLWVVIVGAPHAVVLSGISGDLADPSSAIVNILNPWDTRQTFDNDPVVFNPTNQGYADWLPFQEFASAFGEMAADDYGDWRVLYLPAASTHAASLGGAQLRLARPPAAVHAQALETTSATGEQREPVTPSRVAGTRMSVVRGSAGACRWTLDQLEGRKSAVSTLIDSGNAAIDVRLVLDDWPALEGAATPLPITLEFVADHGSVGEVRITAGTPPLLSHGVEVTARIEDADAVSGVAALAVIVDYRFSGLAQGNPQARIALRLLGDGRHERSNTWVAQPADAVVAG